MNSREESKKVGSTYKNPYLALGSKKKKAPAKRQVAVDLSAVEDS
jgi:hypothetical protein